MAENLPEVKKDMQISVNTENLLQIALEKNVNMETIEKLMSMRRELKEEAAKESYYRALSMFQREIPTIEKEKEVFGKDGKLRYRFASLDSIVSQVKELLEKHGFSYTIITEQDEKSVKAICQAHHIDGYTMETAFKVPIDYDSYMSAPQKIASALTYAKRYSFCNAFGIMTGDADDDAIGSGEAKPIPTKKTQPAQPENLIADIALEQLNSWVSEKLISEGDVKATIQLVAKGPSKLHSLTKLQIEDVMRKCKKVVEMKQKMIEEAKKNDLTQVTGFNPTPVDPSLIPDEVKEAEFYEEDQGAQK